MDKTIIGIAVILASAAALAQTSVSAPLAGDALRATYGDTTQAKNNLTTTINVNTQVDDNALNDNRNKITDAISNFSPNFVWSLTRQRWSLETDYTPSFTYSLEIPGYSRGAHSLSNQLGIRVAQHVNLRLRNSFVRTSDPFGVRSGSQLVPGFGVLDRTNPSFFGPPTQYTSEQTGMDLTYMPAAHTTVGISGTYAANYYEDLVATTLPNRDTHSVGARAFVDQKISPRQSVSLSYGYQVITSPLYGRTVTHSVLVFDNWRLNPKFQISIFGGPQYLESVGTTPVIGALRLKSGLSWSAGGTLGWSAERTGASVSVVRQVSDGGGLGGAVQMTSFTGNVSRRITKKWSADFFGGYTWNGSNTSTSLPYSQIAYASGGLGISREIIRNVSMNVRYEYAHQGTDAGVAFPGILADHNRVQVGLSYSFSHSLGR